MVLEFIERGCILLSLCWHRGVKVIPSVSTLTGNVLNSLNLGGGIRIEDNIIIHDNSVGKYDAGSGICRNEIVPYTGWSGYVLLKR